MTANPPCKHCNSDDTRIHCGNVQCNWVICENPLCRQISIAENV